MELMNWPTAWSEIKSASSGFAPAIRCFEVARVRLRTTPNGIGEVRFRTRSIGQFFGRAVMGCLLVSVLTPAFAADFPPQDHAGTDLTLAEGDRIWGVHTSIGTFRVGAGVSVAVRKFETATPGTGRLEINADNIIVAGVIDATGAGHEGGGGGGGTPGTAFTGPSGAGGSGGQVFRDGTPGERGEDGLDSANGNGGAGAGTWGGLGGFRPASEGSTLDGDNGGYLAPGANGDISTDESISIGSGGGGGAGAGIFSSFFFNRSSGGGGAGGAGGGAIALIASESLNIEGGTILSRGTYGGNGAEPSSLDGGPGGNTLPEEEGLGGLVIFIPEDMFTVGGQGGRGAGGGILLRCDTAEGLMMDRATIDAAGAGNTRFNGGTIKIFFAGEDPTQTAGLNGGRFFSPGFEGTGPTFVDADASGPIRDGKSWGSAYRGVAEALEAPRIWNSPIWVAEGTYRESIALSSGDNLFGGFSGVETDLAERDVVLHPTIIDASTAVAGLPALHVVVAKGVVETLLDGFTLTGGNASQGEHPLDLVGGGILYEMANDTNVVVDCTIVNNSALRRGGGMYLRHADPLILRTTIANNASSEFSGGGVFCVESSPTMRNLTIRGNTADWSGGGIHVEDSSLSIVDSLISENNARVRGGGIFSDGSSISVRACAVMRNAASSGGGFFIGGNLSTEILNTLIEGNTSVLSGAGISIDSGSIVNCTVVNNVAGTFGGGLSTASGSGLSIANTVFAGNQNLAVRIGEFSSTRVFDMTNSLFFNNGGGDVFEGGSIYTGANEINLNVQGARNNFDGDPRFFDEAARNFRLRDRSNALDRGDAAAAPAEDFEGDPRPGSDGLVDIGFDESQSDFTPEPDVLPPDSRVVDAPELVAAAVFQVPYIASDAASGVRHVELFFRLNGGPWRKFGLTFTQSPITLDTSVTGGDGLYEFYTVATDLAGNFESPPAESDDETRVIASLTGNRIYVDLNSPGLQTGASWSNAVHEISDALFVAEAKQIKEIWVADGTYEDSITINDGTALYGGFEGSGGAEETMLDQRDFARNVTTIDATLPIQGATRRRVVLMDAISDARLDGFTITGGNSGSPPAMGLGGGILCLDLGPGNRIANCVIRDNSANGGGGIACISASPAISDCTIIGNLGRSFAGGVYFADSPGASIIRCIISANQTNGDGGGIGNFASTPVIAECIISGNRAGDNGGGVHSRGLSSPMFLNPSSTFLNSAITGNRAGDFGGGIFLGPLAAPHIVNSTVTSNSSRRMKGGGVFVSVNDLTPRPFPIRIQNTIFSDNDWFAIYEEFPGTDLILDTSLFFGNPDSDYFDQGQTAYDSARLINLNVEGARNNISGDPRFRAGESGTWTEAPQWDEARNRTTLFDASASFTPGALSGRIINPNTQDRFEAYITSNTATSVTVVGDLSESVMGDSSYRMIHYQLGDGSEALDRANRGTATSIDFEGDPRPGTDGLVDIGFDEAPSEFAPLANDASLFRHTIPPVVMPGETLEAEIILVNTGQTTWSYDGLFKLALLDDPCDLWDLNFPRINIQPNVFVLPAGNARFPIRLKIPAEFGGCTLRFQMIQEFVEFFGEVVEIELKVQANEAGHWRSYR